MNRGPVPSRVALAAVLALAGCGVAAAPGASRSTTSASPSPSVPAEVVAECVAVQRAYTAWEGHHATVTTAEQVRELNEFTAKSAADAAKEFSNAITGYSDQPAKELVAAAAYHTFAVTLVATSLTVGIEPEAKDASDVVASAQKVKDTYRDFRTRTCGDR